MEYILLIETGTEVCSVALSSDGKLLSIRESDQGRVHAQNIATYTQELLHEHNIGCNDLSAVAISVGPGSYTGLRIASSFAKGVCYAAGVPLIGISSLEALTVGLINEQREGVVNKTNFDGSILAPMIDARRMEQYTQLFTTSCEAISEIAAEIVDNNTFAEYKDRDFIIFGSGAAKCTDVLDVKSVTYATTLPSARNMVCLAHKAFKSSDFKDIAYFEPLYLKEFVSTTKKRDPLQMGKKR